jgi:hypothetical protein
VWSDAIYAESLVGPGRWEDTPPERLDLDEWMEDCLPGLEKDHCRVAVFPAQADAGE